MGLKATRQTVFLNCPWKVSTIMLLLLRVYSTQDSWACLVSWLSQSSAGGEGDSTSSSSLDCWLSMKHKVLIMAINTKRDSLWTSTCERLSRSPSRASSERCWPSSAFRRHRFWSSWCCWCLDDRDQGRVSFLLDASDSSTWPPWCSSPWSCR